jgi:hypothetical protein
VRAGKEIGKNRKFKMAIRVSLIIIDDKMTICLLIYHGDYNIIPINFILGENIAKYS